MLERPPLQLAGLHGGVGRWLKTAALAFAAGFCVCLIALPLLVAKTPAVSDSPAITTGATATALDPRAEVAAPSTASRNPLPAAILPMAPTRVLNVSSAGLRVADRIDVEVGRAMPMPLAFKDALLVPDGALLVLHDVPHGVAVFPATPLASGIWSVELSDAKDLQAVRYINDPVDRTIEARLLGRDGALLAKAQMILIGRSKAAGAAVAHVVAPAAEGGTGASPVAVPDAPAATVAARLTRLDPPVELAEVKFNRAVADGDIVVERVAEVRLPTVEQRPLGQNRPAVSTRVAKSTGTRRLARGEGRQSKRGRHAVRPVQVAAAPLVWPGDPVPRRWARR